MLFEIDCFLSSGLYHFPLFGQFFKGSCFLNGNVKSQVMFWKGFKKGPL